MNNKYYKTVIYWNGNKKIKKIDNEDSKYLDLLNKNKIKSIPVGIKTIDQDDL